MCIDNLLYGVAFDSMVTNFFGTPMGGICEKTLQTFSLFYGHSQPIRASTTVGIAHFFKRNGLDGTR